MTEQPTEQWVQTFLRVVTVAPAGGGGPASALRTAPSGKRAERGQAAGGETGAAQKAAAIKIAACLRAGSAAASVLRRASLLCPLDQHEDLLTSPDSG